jgi:hypothetical protein
MSEIQQKLKAPKGQTNSFGNYKYRSCEDIVEALKPILAEHDLWLNISDEIVHLGDRFYVKATAAIYKTSDDLKDSIGIAVSTAYAREPESKKGMDEAQITGATSSYARKYALNGLLAIDDTKDADSHDNSEPQHRFKPGEKDRVIKGVKEALFNGDEHGLKEILDEYSDPEEKMKVWALFTSTERASIKELMK